jgi:hypothetical protein
MTAPVYPLSLWRRWLLRLAAPKRKPPAPSIRRKPLGKAIIHGIAETTTSTRRNLR